jgi:hypothetical protein
LFLLFRHASIYALGLIVRERGPEPLASVHTHRLLH